MEGKMMSMIVSPAKTSPVSAKKDNLQQ